MARKDAWEGADAAARMTRYETLHHELGVARSRSDIVHDPILNDLGVGEELHDRVAVLRLHGSDNGRGHGFFWPQERRSLTVIVYTPR